MSNEEAPMFGLKWVAEIQGKRCINGKRYCAKIHGDLEHATAETTIYQVLRELVSHLEEQNAEMNYPDSLRVTIVLPEGGAK
jgi:hypothetical protein